MNHRSFCLTILLLGAILVLQGGCGSTDPSRFYLLSGAEEPVAGQDRDGGVAIEIGPVNFPDYLDRQQIAVRTSRNELSLSEFDRWAEPLKANFIRVLAGNLSDLLSTNRVTLFGGTTVIPADCRVAVDVTRFEAGPDGNVTLCARWMLIGAGENPEIHMHDSSIVKPAGEEDDYAAMVAAKSDALGDLSREIAEAIKALK